MPIAVARDGAVAVTKVQDKVARDTNQYRLCETSVCQTNHHRGEQRKRQVTYNAYRFQAVHKQREKNVVRWALRRENKRLTNQESNRSLQATT